MVIRTAAVMLVLCVVVGASATASERRATCSITGTDGNDHLVGTSSRDVICGLRGNDWLEGRGGNDLLLGGAGDDNVEGERGSDVAKGGDGVDYLSAAGGGADRLRGGDGPEHCLWGADGDGNDLVDGGGGRDRYTSDDGDHIVAAERKVAVCDPRPWVG